MRVYRRDKWIATTMMIACIAVAFALFIFCANLRPLYSALSAWVAVNITNKPSLSALVTDLLCFGLFVDAVALIVIAVRKISGLIYTLLTGDRLYFSEDM